MAKILASVCDVTVKYGTQVAVDGVSFDIKEKEILAMIGPNGSGKTSTIECLEGLRIPASGSVAIFGKNPHTQRKEIYSQLGVQLQDVTYPEKIKVAELFNSGSLIISITSDSKIFITKSPLIRILTLYLIRKK